MTFSDLLRLVRRYVVLMLVTTALGAGAGGAWAILTPTTYASTATLAVVPRAGTTDAGQDPMTGAIAGMMQTFATSVTTAEVLKPVQENVAPDQTLNELRGRVSVRVPTASMLMEITATGSDPESAAALADGTAASLSQVVTQLAPKNPANQQPTITTVNMQQGADAINQEGASLPVFIVAGAVIGFVIGALVARARVAVANQKELEAIAEGAETSATSTV